MRYALILGLLVVVGCGQQPAVMPIASNDRSQEVASLNSQVAELNAQLAAEKKRHADELAALSEKSKQIAIEEGKRVGREYAEEKLRELQSQQDQRSSEADLAVRLSKLTMVERNKITGTIKSMRAGEKLTARQIQELEYIPEIRGELEAYAIAQEKDSELSKLLKESK